TRVQTCALPILLPGGVRHPGRLRAAGRVVGTGGIPHSIHRRVRSSARADPLSPHPFPTPIPGTTAPHEKRELLFTSPVTSVTLAPHTTIGSLPGRRPGHGL